jgi:hypothetical protein
VPTCSPCQCGSADTICVIITYVGEHLRSVKAWQRLLTALQWEANFEGLMQIVTSKKCIKNTIRKNISQTFFWCLCRNWQIMLGCPLGGCFVATLHGVSSPQRRFASLMVSSCHPRKRHPQHVSVLKVASIMLLATCTHFSCRWCYPSFQLRTVCSVRMCSSKWAIFWGMKPCNRPERTKHAPMG